MGLDREGIVVHGGIDEGPCAAGPVGAALPAGVSLHLVPVTAGEAEVAAAWADLTGDEQVRAARFVRPADRLRFGLTRAALRRRLAAALAVAPSAVAFDAGPAGKPFLRAVEGLDFNVSHSGGFALVALSRVGPVGVDIEQARTGVDILGIARAHFAPQEHEALARLPAGRRGAAFYRLWTLKEAIAKAHGTGIATGTPTVPAPLWLGAEPEAGAPDRVCGARVWRLAAPRGHAAALALVPEAGAVSMASAAAGL
ncbi:4'-phosphopantetheinyl transferase family protein [Xanthobacter sediminis]